MFNTRTCRKCSSPKTIEHFEVLYRRGKRVGQRHQCKECREESSKKHRQTPSWRAKNRAVKKLFYAQLRTDPDKLLKHQIQQCKYAITVEEYKKLLESQNGVCALCHKKERRRRPDGAEARLAIDHNHKTGKVRGLLCSKCNMSVTSIEQDSEWINRAMEYLK